MVRTRPVSAAEKEAQLVATLLLSGAGLDPTQLARLMAHYGADKSAPPSVASLTDGLGNSALSYRDQVAVALAERQERLRRSALMDDALAGLVPPRGSLALPSHSHQPNPAHSSAEATISADDGDKLVASVLNDPRALEEVAANPRMASVVLSAMVARLSRREEAQRAAEAEAEAARQEAAAAAEAAAEEERQRATRLQQRCSAENSFADSTHRVTGTLRVGTDTLARASHGAGLPFSSPPPRPKPLAASVGTLTSPQPFAPNVGMGMGVGGRADGRFSSCASVHMSSDRCDDANAAANKSVVAASQEGGGGNAFSSRSRSQQQRATLLVLEQSNNRRLAEELRDKEEEIARLMQQLSVLQQKGSATPSIATAATPLRSAGGSAGNHGTPRMGTVMLTPSSAASPTRHGTVTAEGSAASPPPTYHPQHRFSSVTSCNGGADGGNVRRDSVSGAAGVSPAAARAIDVALRASAKVLIDEHTEDLLRAVHAGATAAAIASPFSPNAVSSANVNDSTVAGGGGDASTEEGGGAMAVFSSDDVAALEVRLIADALAAKEEELREAAEGLEGHRTLMTSLAAEAAKWRAAIAQSPAEQQASLAKISAAPFSEEKRKELCAQVERSCEMRLRTATISLQGAVQRIRAAERRWAALEGGGDGVAGRGSSIGSSSKRHSVSLSTSAAAAIAARLSAVDSTSAVVSPSRRGTATASVSPSRLADLNTIRSRRVEALTAAVEGLREELAARRRTVRRRELFTTKRPHVSASPDAGNASPSSGLHFTSDKEKSGGLFGGDAVSGDAASFTSSRYTDPLFSPLRAASPATAACKPPPAQTPQWRRSEREGLLFGASATPHSHQQLHEGEGNGGGASAHRRTLSGRCPSVSVPDFATPNRCVAQTVGASQSIAAAGRSSVSLSPAAAAFGVSLSGLLSPSARRLGAVTASADDAIAGANVTRLDGSCKGLSVSQRIASDDPKAKLFDTIASMGRASRALGRELAAYASAERGLCIDAEGCDDDAGDADGMHLEGTILLAATNNSFGGNARGPQQQSPLRTAAGARTSAPSPAPSPRGDGSRAVRFAGAHAGEGGDAAANVRIDFSAAVANADADAAVPFEDAYDSDDEAFAAAAVRHEERLKQRAAEEAAAAAERLTAGGSVMMAAAGPSSSSASAGSPKSPIPPPAHHSPAHSPARFGSVASEEGGEGEEDAKGSMGLNDDRAASDANVNTCSYAPNGNDEADAEGDFRSPSAVRGTASAIPSLVTADPEAAAEALCGQLSEAISLLHETDASLKAAEEALSAALADGGAMAAIAGYVAGAAGDEGYPSPTAASRGTVNGGHGGTPHRRFISFAVDAAANGEDSRSASEALYGGGAATPRGGGCGGSIGGVGGVGHGVGKQLSAYQSALRALASAEEEREAQRAVAAAAERSLEAALREAVAAMGLAFPGDAPAHEGLVAVSGLPYGYASCNGGGIACDDDEDDNANSGRLTALQRLHAQRHQHHQQQYGGGCYAAAAPVEASPAAISAIISSHPHLSNLKAFAESTAHALAATEERVAAAEIQCVLAEAAGGGGGGGASSSAAIGDSGRFHSALSGRSTVLGRSDGAAASLRLTALAGATYGGGGGGSEGHQRIGGEALYGMPPSVAQQRIEALQDTVRSLADAKASHVGEVRRINEALMALRSHVIGN